MGDSRVQEVSEDEPALDLGALAKRWGPCGSCDFGAPMSCTCDPGDPRVDIARLIAEVERLTVERDQARDIACHLEQQAAEALRVAQEAVSRDKLLRTYRHSWALLRDALGDIVRILGDEAENHDG